MPAHRPAVAIRRLVVPVLLVAAALIVLPNVLGRSDTDAQAATAGRWRGGGTYIGGVVFDNEPVVAWTVPGRSGAVAVCVTQSVDPPYAAYGAPIQLTGSKAAIAGTLAGLYLNSSSSDATIGEVAAYIASLYDPGSTKQGWVNRGAAGMSTAHQATLVQRATKLAGPYKVTASGLPASTDHSRKVNTTYTARFHVASANGTAVPATTVVFAHDTNVIISAPSAVTNSQGDVSLTWRVRPGLDRDAAISATVRDVESAYHYRNGRTQDLVGAGATKSHTYRFATHVSPYVPTTLVKVDADARHTPLAGARLVITEASTTIATVTTPAGTVSLPHIRPGHTYVVTEKAAPSGYTLQMTPKTFTVSATATSVSWQFENRKIPAPRPPVPPPAAPPPPEPLIKTHVVDLVDVVGTGPLIDTVVLSQTRSDDGTVSDVLYGPVDVPESGECADVLQPTWNTALVAAHTPDQKLSSARADADGTRTFGFTARPQKPWAAGCYAWKAAVMLTPSGATALSLQSAPGEQTRIVAPTGRTAASAQIVLTGEHVNDTVTLEGNVRVAADGTRSLIGLIEVMTYFHPQDTAAAPCPTGVAGWAPLLEDGSTVTVVSTLIADGVNGTYLTEDYVPAEPGCVTWAESWRLEEDSASVLLSAAGQEHERVTVLAPPSTETPPTPPPSSAPKSSVPAVPPATSAPASFTSTHARPAPSTPSVPPVRASLSSTPLRPVIRTGLGAAGTTTARGSRWTRPLLGVTVGLMLGATGLTVASIRRRTR